MSAETTGLIIGFLMLMATTIGLSLASSRSLRKEMRAGHKELRTEIIALRTDMKEGDQDLRTEIIALRTQMQKGDEALRKDIGRLTQRVDETNARVDNLAESLYPRRVEEAGA